MAAPCALNFNVGVLGHIDSGKTSLSKALSTIASTASFDKNPQSKERGITLDLGFSSFCVDLPEHMKDCKHDKLQYTLVDCPGHASLIRTIIGGAQIIDLMILVVDVVKGMQTQTAECLVIGEIACNKMLVVLNKIDLLPEASREATIQKMTKRLLKTLEPTKFAGSPIIPVAAKPGGPEAAETGSFGVEKLVDALKQHSYRPVRKPDGPFIFAVDHCFSIRGQGTVMTGTVNSGSVAINDTVEIPAMKVTKKVKSMQMFRQPVEKAMQGDRVALCVTQFDPKQLERGLVCTPNALPTIVAAIVDVNKIAYHKGSINTNAKFHITMGHETVMAKIVLFGLLGNESEKTTNDFNWDNEYLYLDELMTKSSAEAANMPFPSRQFAVLEFEKPVTCSSNCLVIGSRLDTDIHSNVCRLAFHGSLLVPITDTQYIQTILPKLRIFKTKCREGFVERMADEYSVIGRSLFKKESNIEAFVGLKVTLSTGEDGVIEGGFGQSGKFKVRIHNGLLPDTKEVLSVKKKKSKKEQAAEKASGPAEDSSPAQAIKISLTFKRYIYDPKKQMHQK